MAEQDPQAQSRSALASTWPNPPPFFRDFTDENLARFKQLADSQSEPETEGAPVKRIPDVPAELANLQPPAEPADGVWRVFGDQYSVRIFFPFYTVITNHGEIG